MSLEDLSKRSCEQEMDSALLRSRESGLAPRELSGNEESGLMKDAMMRYEKEQALCVWDWGSVMTL